MDFNSAKKSLLSCTRLRTDKVCESFPIQLCRRTQAGSGKQQLELVADTRFQFGHAVKCPGNLKCFSARRRCRTHS